MPRPYISPPSFLRRPAIAPQYITIYLDSTLYGGKGDVGLSPEEEYNVRHQDYVMEMPQSGERIRGREKMREFQEAYPNPPTMQLRRVIVRDGLWVVEIVSDYGGRIYRPVLIIELRDGKMFRDTRYYSEPFEAPEWRARWVERM
jgi:hypothetical protein